MCTYEHEPFRCSVFRDDGVREVCLHQTALCVVQQANTAAFCSAVGTHNSIGHRKVISSLFLDEMAWICGMLPSADRLCKSLSADFFALGVNKTPKVGQRGCLLHTLDLKSFVGVFDSGVFTTLFFREG